jgi:hypothetical protein
MKYPEQQQLRQRTTQDEVTSKILENKQKQEKINKDAYYRSNALRLGNTVSSLGTPNYALENARTLGNLKATTNTAALAAGGYGLWNAPVQTAYGIAGGIGGSILGDKIGQAAEEHLEAPEYTSDLASFAGSMLGGYYGTKAAPEYVASLPEILTKPGETFFKMFPYKTYHYLRYGRPTIMPTLKKFFNTDIRNHPLKKAKFQWLRDQLRH